VSFDASDADERDDELLRRPRRFRGVDATNTTGAVALYEKVGMRAVTVMEAYEHDLG